MDAAMVVEVVVDEGVRPEDAGATGAKGFEAVLGEVAI